MFTCILSRGMTSNRKWSVDMWRGMFMPGGYTHIYRAGHSWVHHSGWILKSGGSRARVWYVCQSSSSTSYMHGRYTSASSSTQLEPRQNSEWVTWTNYMNIFQWTNFCDWWPCSHIVLKIWLEWSNESWTALSTWIYDALTTHWRCICIGLLQHLDIVWAAWGFTLSYCAAALKCKHSSKSKSNTAKKKTQQQSTKRNVKSHVNTLTLSSHPKGRYLWKTRIFTDSTNSLSLSLTCGYSPQRQFQCLVWNQLFPFWQTVSWPSARKSASRVAQFLCWARKNEAVTSGVWLPWLNKANNTMETAAV